MKPAGFRLKRVIRRGSALFALGTILLSASILPGMPFIGDLFSGQRRGINPVALKSDESLAKGKFLVASRKLKDPNFREAVVLLIDYQVHGALGLVINHPTEARLSSLLPEIEGLSRRMDRIFLGGPVGRGGLMMLIQSTRKPENSRPVFDGIYVSSSMRVLKQMTEDPAPKDKFRVYVGYSGWAPGQLDREVLRGDWHVLKAETETVFNRAPSKIWDELIDRGTQKWVKVR